MSNWRQWLPDEFIAGFLDHLGLLRHFHPDWRAPLRFSSDKAQDIADWLAEHLGGRPQDCLVIDDHQVRTTLPQVEPASNIGFSDDDLRAALRIFREARPYGLSVAAQDTP